MQMFLAVRKESCLFNHQPKIFQHEKQAFISDAGPGTGILRQETFERWAGRLLERLFPLPEAGRGRAYPMGRQNINIGTVTYGIDNNANFYVTYDCGSSGWLISESHMFAGDKSDMPLNRPGSPKVGRFPYSADHQPRVSCVTYTVPLTELPPAEEPGFVVASHCVVHGPGGRTETAWAEGDYTFSDKGWGWYDIYYYNQADNPFTVFYGTQCSADSFSLLMLNVTNMTSDVVFSEYLGNGAGPFGGAAFDPVNKQFFFTDLSTGELWVTTLQNDAPPFIAGMLEGYPSGGAIGEYGYYYADMASHTIKLVTFSDNWAIQSVQVRSNLPPGTAVNDIALNPSETSLCLACERNGYEVLLIWDISHDTYTLINTGVPRNSQVIFGSDGFLYVIAGGCSDSTLCYALDLENSIFNPITDTVIFLEDPFFDLSAGPVM
jgi:hypothetical protein